MSFLNFLKIIFNDNCTEIERKSKRQIVINFYFSYYLTLDSRFIDVG